MDVEEKVAELAKTGIGCPRAVSIRGPKAIEDWADDHLERLELESWLAAAAERGILCPPEVAKEGREAVVDWLQEHDTEPRVRARYGDGEGPESRELEVLELLEGVDPIEVLETIVNQSSELLAKMREEADGGRDPVELLEELVSSVPAPEGFLQWVRQVAGGPEPHTDEPEVDFDVPPSADVSIDRLKAHAIDHGERISGLERRVSDQESQGVDQWRAIEALQNLANPDTPQAKLSRGEGPELERFSTGAPAPPRRRRGQRSRQCKGTTKAGKRCRRQPVSGDVLCPQHGGVTGKGKASPAEA